MTLFRNIILVLLVASRAQAEGEIKKPQVDELTTAYQREILFLSTYKKELQSKIQSIQSNLGQKVTEARKDLTQLESEWLRAQTNNELLIQKLSDVERDYENRQENRDLLNTTLKQAALSGAADGVASEGEKIETPLIDQITGVYSTALTDLDKTLKVQKSKGSFFLKNGEEKQGHLISLGTVARFAEVDGRVASLYPTGGGHFRVWEWLDGSAASLKEGRVPESLKFFLFENAEKEFTAQKEKTTMDVLRSGGLIGWVIVVMGLFAALISVIRYGLLRRAQSHNDQRLSEAVSKIQGGEVEEAQHLLVRENSAVSRVLTKTLSYLKSEPQKVEDAIMEAILKESQTIDRFGVVILVIASVAPLMGLLGTVTGMISTFDIITLYGTGNPKLLSGGISEALVTTMFGLIVAIPALLVGQFLSSKTEGIKSDMEKWALAACNAYKNQPGPS